MSSPSLPSEMIDHILSFYFESNLPVATPTSVDPSSSPLRSSSHLLLVSKLFHSLTLPHLFKSFTILTSNDYIVYWHPTSGIFAGERGREKASWVQELQINSDQTTQLPIDLPLVRYNNNKRNPELPRILIDLSPAPLPRLKHICFFEIPNQQLEVHEREKKAGRGLAGDEELQEDIRRFKRISRMKRRTRSTTRMDSREAKVRIEGIQRILSSSSLKIERHLLFHHLLSSSPPIQSVRMQLNHAHIAILLFETLPTLPLYPPLSIYPCCPNNPYGETTFFATSEFVAMVFESKTPCDFIGVPAPCRRAVVRDGRTRGGGIGRREGWRWVNEDGSFDPFMDV